ncbi:MAG: hypothetical protein H8M99_07860 [Gloeobacteraceae cyanobacterium ES-bin-144]|nr:hypothetical protein [Verrucomicrobiales bacterium]
MAANHDISRVKQIAVGVGILLTVMLLVCGALLGWGHLPGLLGEWIGMMIGLMTTPFFLEASFFVIGLTLVVAINHWNQKRDGEEFVYLEQVKGGASKLPDHAKWAIYQKEPLAGEEPSLLAQAEGALAIGDYEAATELIGKMSEAEMKRPETLRLRIELAKSTGREELVGELEKCLSRIENTD